MDVIGALSISVLLCPVLKKQDMGNYFALLINAGSYKIGNVD